MCARALLARLMATNTKLGTTIRREYTCEMSKTNKNKNHKKRQSLQCRRAICEFCLYFFFSSWSLCCIVIGDQRRDHFDANNSAASCRCCHRRGHTFSQHFRLGICASIAARLRWQRFSHFFFRFIVVAKLKRSVLTIECARRLLLAAVDINSLITHTFFVYPMCVCLFVFVVLIFHDSSCATRIHGINKSNEERTNKKWSASKVRNRMDRLMNGLWLVRC